MAYCWRHTLAMLLLAMCALCLWLCVLRATLLLPETMRHIALLAINMDAYVTVARCRGTGGTNTGTVSVPYFSVIWIMTTAAFGLLDVVALGYGSGTALGAIYCMAKLHVAVVLRVLLSLDWYIQLADAIDGSAASHAVWPAETMGEPLTIEVREQDIGAIKQFLSDQAQLLDNGLRRMWLHVFSVTTLPPELFHHQWASLRSLRIATDECIMPADTMAALISATPNLYELSMINVLSDTQFAANWTLVDGWSKLCKVTLESCDNVLWHCVTLQTKQVARATFKIIWPHTVNNPPLLKEFVRRNGRTLTHMDTDSFGMDELELLAQCHSLQQITVDCTAQRWVWAAFTWHRFATLIQSIQSLRVVSLVVGPMPSDIELAPGALHHLTTLLLNSAQIPTQAVHSILQAAPNLHSLQLTTVQGAIDCDTLQSIVSSVPQLRKLRLATIGTMNDGVLRTIAVALPQLTHLWLAYEHIVDEDSGDAGQWSTVHGAPQHVLKRIKLIRLDPAGDHTEAEAASAQRLRSALSALVGRSHGVLGTAAARLDHDMVHMAGACPVAELAELQLDDNAMLPDKWPDICDMLW